MGDMMHNESQWRYRAKRRGLRLVRYGQPLGFEEYGPYGLVDRATGRTATIRLTAEDVEQRLFGDDAEDAILAGGSSAKEPRQR